MSAQIRIQQADGTSIAYPTTSLIDGTNMVLESATGEAVYVIAVDRDRVVAELVAANGTVRKVEVVA